MSEIIRFRLLCLTPVVSLILKYKSKVWICILIQWVTQHLHSHSQIGPTRKYIVEYEK